MHTATVPTINPAAFIVPVGMDPNAIAEHLDALSALCQQCRDGLATAATCVLSNLLPSCTRLQWDAAHELSDGGGDLVSVEVATLYFSDRDPVHIPGCDNHGSMDALVLQFQCTEDAVLDRFEQAYPNEEREQLEERAFAEALGLDVASYRSVWAAALYLIWGEPDAGLVQVKSESA